MLQRSVLKTILSTGLLLTFVAGCAGPSPRSNYYLLSALPDLETGEATTAALDGLMIPPGRANFG